MVCPRDSPEGWEPGAAAWLEQRLGAERTPGWESTVQGLEAGGSVEAALRLLPALLVSSDCTGRLVARLLALLLPGPAAAPGPAPEFPLLPQQELLLDLLDATEHPMLLSYGGAVATLVMQVRAGALAAMLQQEDWQWFFGEQSEFVSHAVENSEAVLAHCAPRGLEDSRLAAARALGAWGPVLAARQAAGLPVVLQYGLANLVTAGLTLLQDEEPEVRDEAARFASCLPRDEAALPWPELSLQLATESLVCWSLGQLHQVATCLAPVSRLLAPGPAIPLHTLGLPDSPLGLFRRGDGVNVFQEDSFTLALYYRCIRFVVQY
jgi:hypothetical protein